MNKNALKVGLVVIVLGIVVVMAGIIPFFNILGVSGLYVLAISHPVVNDSYPVYKTVTPDITDEEVKRIGALFNVSGDVQDYIPSTGISRIADYSKDPYAVLEVYRNSGAFRYQIPDKALPYSTDRQPDLPSDEEARAIATKYLEDRNLLSDDMHFTTVSIGSQSGEGSPTSLTLYDLTKDVRFVKEIQGIQVYSGGITVSIGDKGEVVSAGSSLRELKPEPFRYVKIITPEQAYLRLLSNDVVIRLTCCTGNYIVNNISLGYWMESESSPQKYVLPVYVFSCVSRDGTEEFNLYVWAIELSEMQEFS
jgi:hypothetical protein